MKCGGIQKPTARNLKHGREQRLRKAKQQQQHLLAARIKQRQQDLTGTAVTAINS